jgi:hypothetical protein
MSRNQKQIPNWAKAGHQKPVTRREFLAHGLIPFAAATFMPNWLKLLSPEAALAQTACPTGGSGMVPFIQLNLEGGAGLAANYVPMSQDRQLLPSYDIIGLGSPQNLNVVRVFNNAPFAGNGVSNVLTGLQSAANQATQNNTAFLGLCVQSRDDSSENYFACNGLVHRAGLVGTRLPSMGNRDSASGINQMPALFSPPSPLVVRSFNDLSNSLGYTASLAALSQTQREKLTKLVSDLNTSQARKLATVNNGQQMQDLLKCAGIKNTELVRDGAAAVDPRTNAGVANVWGLNAQSQLNSESFVLGSMVYNTILGNAGSASFSKGGYDYHGNDRQTVTNVRDREAGVLIGRILETARVLNQPVFLMVTSDGAVSSDASATPGGSNFNSDRGSAGMVYCFLYDPNGRPATTDFQIGHYGTTQNPNSQSADTSFIIGGNPELATQAVFLNWLKMNNKLDLYNVVVPRGRGFDTAQIAQVVKVG